MLPPLSLLQHLLVPPLVFAMPVLSEKEITENQGGV